MKNKAQVEGVLYEAYIAEEISIFANHFFGKKCSILKNNKSWEK